MSAIEIAGHPDRRNTAIRGGRIALPCDWSLVLELVDVASRVGDFPGIESTVARPPNDLPSFRELTGRRELVGMETVTVSDTTVNKPMKSKAFREGTRVHHHLVTNDYLLDGRIGTIWAALSPAEPTAKHASSASEASDLEVVRTHSFGLRNQFIHVYPPPDDEEHRQHP